MYEHTLRGTFKVHNAADAEEKAQSAASDYFGDVPLCVDVDVEEIRTLGDQVVGYTVGYTAVVDQRDEWAAPR